MKGFEVIENNRNSLQPEVVQGGDIVKSGRKLVDAAADNFENILKLASDIASIQKMKTQNECAISQMKETREMLLSEAKCYAIKKEADTRSVVERMEVIRSMMNDFYKYSSQNMTGEVFCQIITEIVNQMGKLENDK
jgi:hypothetical protein